MQSPFKPFTRAQRAAIRRDLARGDAAVHRVAAVDAIEVEAGEDEGSAFFILTGDGRTMIFSGRTACGTRR